jgi:hypothetical protein
LFEGGDLDNRLKTFFDALRVPHLKEQLPAEIGCPEVDEKAIDWPFMFCLLDDDRAITKLYIESLQMLTALGSIVADLPRNDSRTGCYHFATQLGSTRQHWAGRE